VGEATSVIVPEAASYPRTVRLLNRLTGIRAIAALFVVLLHYSDSVSKLFPIFGAFRFVYIAGGMGVDLFFILSGFILSHNYLHQFHRVSLHDYRRFLEARLARVYPVHFATLLFLSVIVVIAALAGKPMNGTHYGISRWLENLMLLQSWPGFGDSLSWNYPACSVSSEWFAYLLFPLLAPFIIRARKPAIWAAASLALFAVPACAGWIREGNPSNWAILRVSAEFLYGAFLYRLYDSRVRCPLTPLSAGFATISLTLALSFYGWHLTWAVPVYGILLWSLAERADGPLGGPIAVYLGQVSYSLYMTHGVLQIVLNRIWPADRFVHSSSLIRLAVIVVYGVSISLAALVVYHWVETPGRRAVLRLFREKTIPSRNISPELSKITT